MKIIRGKVLQKGKIVLDNLQCKIQFHTAIGGIKSWAGRFDLLPGRTISPGDHRVALHSGRGGMMSIVIVLAKEVKFVGVWELDWWGRLWMLDGRSRQDRALTLRH